jgi:hypothetical protein
VKIKLALEHSDEVSGTWIMDDGTRCYWSEGRSSLINCIRPDGSRMDFPCLPLSTSDAELVACLTDTLENGPDSEDWRMMTPSEEAEHDAVRNS